MKTYVLNSHGWLLLRLLNCLLLVGYWCFCCLSKSSLREIKNHGVQLPKLIMLALGNDAVVITISPPEALKMKNKRGVSIFRLLLLIVGFGLGDFIYQLSLGDAANYRVAFEHTVLQGLALCYAWSYW